MTDKHTPGPWHDIGIGTRHLISPSIDDDGKFAIASIFFPNYHPDGLTAARVEQEANAALIAAAPDLLAALRAMLAAGPYGNADAYNAAVGSSFAAIARAEGR